MKNRALFAYAFAYLAFLYVPVLVLPVFSFNNSEFIAFPLSGFTTRWYAGLASDTAMQHALGNSLKVGLVTALLSTMLGLTAAKAVTHYRLKGAGAALGFISLPLFIPDIVLGISLLLLLGALGLPLSLAAVVVVAGAAQQGAVLQPEYLPTVGEVHVVLVGAAAVGGHHPVTVSDACHWVAFLGLGVYFSSSSAGAAGCSALGAIALTLARMAWANFSASSAETVMTSPEAPPSCWRTTTLIFPLSSKACRNPV